MLTSGGTGSRLRIRQDERAGRVNHTVLYLSFDRFNVFFLVCYGKLGGLNKRRQQQQHAGGGVSGFSSLAFTPVQGKSNKM